jgi:hypothetical protein
MNNKRTIKKGETKRRIETGTQSKVAKESTNASQTVKNEQSKEEEKRILQISTKNTKI